MYVCQFFRINVFPTHLAKFKDAIQKRDRVPALRGELQRALTLSILILLLYMYKKSRGRMSLKNQPRDVIKMTELRGEVGTKTSKKEMDNTSFL